jgi:hypothetical protein
MSGPTFNDIRRQFGTGLALAWTVMLWRWGLLGAGVRSNRPRVRYARRRPPNRAKGVAEWIVLAIVGSAWLFWAVLMVKGIVDYTRHGP